MPLFLESKKIQIILGVLIVSIFITLGLALWPSSVPVKALTPELLEASILGSSENAFLDSLLEEGVTVAPESGLHEAGKTLNFPLQMKDLLLVGEEGETHFQLTEEYMNYVLEALERHLNIEEEHLRIIGVNAEKADYAETVGQISDGQYLAREMTAKLIQNAVRSGEKDAMALLVPAKGKILNESGVDLGPLDLLGSGFSDFQGSLSGREHNIRWAIDEHYNGILVPPGETFAFNDFLGEISSANGWQKSYIIVRGTELEYQLGGGICQVPTTIYRAVLDAGLEVVEHRTHSLYVDFYQYGGDGLDATIFPAEYGGQDFVFRNDTEHYLFMLSNHDGYEAIVSLYGHDDGRKTTLEGPYTENNQTDEVIAGVGQPLRYYQIAWKYTIERPDGTLEEEWFLSTYNSKVKQYE